MLRGGSQAEINSTVSRDQVRLIEEGPGIARGADGKPLVSAELYLVVDGIKRSSQTKANLPLRGIGPRGRRVRKGITIVEGRMFNPGATRSWSARRCLREFQGFELGATVDARRPAAGPWSACSRPTAACSSRRSGPISPVVQSLFKRANFFQTVRARLESPAALAALKRYVDDDPRLKLDVKSEAAYFAEQSSQTSDLIQKLGWPLAIAMAFGALAGALNTMYSLGRRPRGRDRDPAGDRLRRLPGLHRHDGRIARFSPRIGGVHRRARDLSGLRRLHRPRRSAASFTQVVFSFKLSPA